MQNIAISSVGPGLDSMVDGRFGRAAGFVIVDPATRQHRYIDNGAGQIAAQGAGIQAAETISKANAGTLLTGVVGPKAAVALQSAGIKYIEGCEQMTVGAALDAYLSGALSK